MYHGGKCGSNDGEPVSPRSSPPARADCRRVSPPAPSFLHGEEAYHSVVTDRSNWPTRKLRLEDDEVNATASLTPGEPIDVEPNFDFRVVFDELAKLENDETALAIFGLFEAESSQDSIQRYAVADATQRSEYQRKIEAIFAQADQRFWQRARARGLKIPFPPYLQRGHE